MSAVPVDLGNQQHVQKRNKRLKVDRAKLDEAFRWLMADERGRLFIVHQLRESGALTPTVAATVDGALFKEGRRAHGLALFQDIGRLCPQHLGAIVAAVQQTGPLTTGDDDGNDTAGS